MIIVIDKFFYYIDLTKALNQQNILLV